MDELLDKLGSLNPTMRTTGQAWDLEARVLVTNTLAKMMDPEEDDTCGLRADTLMRLIWERVGYRFVRNRLAEYENGLALSIYYDCAQSEHNHRNSLKHKDPEKHRDKRSMSCFPCRGFLRLVVSSNSDVIIVCYRHEQAHVPYECIDIPKYILEFVAENYEKTPAQLWKDILKMEDNPKFSRKSVLHLQREIMSKQWKSGNPEESEWESALKLLARAEIDLAKYPLQQVPLPEEKGYMALAFCIPYILRKWQGRLREILLDSTWGTNGKNFELYVIIGEAYGSGLPLAFLLIKVDGVSIPHVKAKFISTLLHHITFHYKLDIQFVHTDKDATEINACRNSLPQAIHPLCYWHVLRAVKTRLATLRRAPAYYDFALAHSEYNWIDTNFRPVGQGGDEFYIPAKTLPILNIRFDGKLQPTPTPTLLPIPTSTPSQDIRNKVPGPPDGESIPDGLDGEINNFLEQVEKVLEEEKDHEDGPDWMFEEGEKSAKDPSYIFCPAVHHKGALRLLTKHFCQHPFLPDQFGTHSAQDIRDTAVLEMYTYCHKRGLSEVWGYMWTSWYQPRQWARSSSSTHLSRLQTTMTVENFWKQLKHDFLHHYSRPRLDHLIWVLAVNVIPNYIQCATVLEDTHLMGRSKPLTARQKAFKLEWKKLTQRPIISGRDYSIDVYTWTCNCGQQKYSAYLLCKHLVQAVPTPSPDFYSQIYIRRCRPFYLHAELRPIGYPLRTVEGEYGSVSDGDDHIWSGDVTTLWSPTKWKPLHKRKRSPSSSPSKENSPYRLHSGLKPSLQHERADCTTFTTSSILSDKANTLMVPKGVADR